MRFDLEALRHSLEGLPRADRYRVAYSGGGDSHALLHAFAQLRPALGSVRMDAIHVHHGLSPNADAWASHSVRIAAELGVSCTVVHVDVLAVAGASREASARRVRYQALAHRLRPGDALLTAHQLNDQAETLLLQLLRGCGVRGLAGMPAVTALGAGWLMRPLLPFTRGELREYLHRKGQDWFEDESNEDLTLARNFVRREVLPLLERRWPAAARCLARSAGHCGQATALLEEVARGDLLGAGEEPDGALSVQSLRQLPPTRQRNVLRSWLVQQGLPLPSSTVLGRIVSECLVARRDASPLVAWRGVEVRRYRGRLYAGLPLPPFSARSLRWDGHSPLELPLPVGRLTVSQGCGVGLCVPCLDRGSVEVGFRAGSEYCRPAGRGHRRPLKKLLQELAIPPWLRPFLPLVRIDGELAAIADLVMCEPFVVKHDRPGRMIRWHRDRRLFRGVPSVCEG